MTITASGPDAIMILVIGIAVCFALLYIAVYNAIRHAILDTRPVERRPVTPQGSAIGVEPNEHP